MNKTLEQLKYRIEKNKYIAADHVRAVIREVDESGFYPSAVFEAVPQSSRLGGEQENRIWLMGAVSVSKVRR